MVHTHSRAPGPCVFFTRDPPPHRASCWPPHGRYRPARRWGELQALEDARHLGEAADPGKPRGHCDSEVPRGAIAAAC